MITLLLDVEHQKIIDQLNNLAVNASGSFSSAQIAMLQTDFRLHCRHEEEVMIAVDYPYIHAHILAHTIAAKYFLRLLMADGSYLASHLIADILDHINTYDVAFAEYALLNNIVITISKT